jgi:glyoxylase-like metal-dependent hydrolase (beta-lactamase superfamily II)
MRVDRIEPDILVFRGDEYESVATAFLHDADVLLVDALASRRDGEWMRRHLEEELGKKVRIIVSTHYMNDHMAGLRLFPDARIVAHRYFMHTFLSQRNRSVEDDEDFVFPTIVIGDGLTLEWGRHTLALFHNPGKTLCTICIDVPDCDLLFASDNVVGNIAYISSSAPELIGSAIARLQQLRRGRVIPGHMGVLKGEALGNARGYLERLGERVREARRHGAEAEAIHSIDIEDCLASGVEPTAFEREWHGRNLDVILERRLFTLGASGRAARWAPHSRGELDPALLITGATRQLR